MFANLLKSNVARLIGVVLIGGLILAAVLVVLPASKAFAADATATPQASPAVSTAAKVSSAKLEQDFQKEQLELKDQGNNLNKLDAMVTKGGTFLTNLKGKGKDIEVLQTVLDVFKQDVDSATAFHNSADQILTTHAGFDNNGKVIDQTQAAATVMTAKDKLMEARLVIRGAAFDLRGTLHTFRQGRIASPQAAPQVTPTPTSVQ